MLFQIRQLCIIQNWRRVAAIDLTTQAATKNLMVALSPLVGYMRMKVCMLHVYSNTCYPVTILWPQTARTNLNFLEMWVWAIPPDCAEVRSALYALLTALHSLWNLWTLTSALLHWEPYWTIIVMKVAGSCWNIESLVIFGQCQRISDMDDFPCHSGLFKVPG